MTLNEWFEGFKEVTKMQLIVLSYMIVPITVLSLIIWCISR